jgi:hypothetical protein
MNLRVVLLASSLAAVPAWSQETPAFDLGSAAIRRIVHATAATQYGELPPPEEPVAESKSYVVRFVPPEKPEKETPPPRPAATPDRHDGPISALVDTLIDDWLGIGPDDPFDVPYDDWLRCPARAEGFSLSELTQVCPGRQSTWGLTEPVGYVPRELRPR